MTVKIDIREIEVARWNNITAEIDRRIDVTIWDDKDIQFEFEGTIGFERLIITVDDLREIVESAEKFIEARKERKNA